MRAVVILLALPLILQGCAAYYSSQVPMTRAARSSFQPYKSDAGESRFLMRSMYFNSETGEKNNPLYQQWLQEWFRQYDYCRNGHVILSNVTEAFATSSHLGGHLVTTGQCK